MKTFFHLTLSQLDLSALSSIMTRGEKLVCVITGVKWVLKPQVPVQADAQCWNQCRDPGVKPL